MADELGRLGLKPEISECEGIALVGIWAVGLPVWCEWMNGEWRFRWSVETVPGGGERFTTCPGSAVETAARRVVRAVRERASVMYGDTRRWGVAR
ncbi:hypothetical protein [Nonomuraea sp. NPDC049709]|uniref:hypothetical protein n=1 Tax=Nonomuraea sp. NPDC049709 TaxID=3154736 RepID=UPI0034448888